MESPKKLKIASLGSSFAAGPDIPPQIEPRAALRSGQNYPHLLAQHLNADLTDLSVSGATLLNITVDPQSTPFNVTFPPQISNLPEDANIITVTAGGNDINYIGGMIADACDAELQSSVALSPSELAERLGGSSIRYTNGPRELESSLLNILLFWDLALKLVGISR
ncbi:hypothetical protein N7471_004312 [Penicillium samsonianum]|uniref:uncharacterized protein n=1 Tax=Penicillium samsonianum TaxID=1882272 RepID=UPI00254937A8|nr:uncharacterized protein N7471_004312 [Penicillium samsonianum]KAJ6137826.1 hypothetical protein N7471_004312 [Penicillium samsonianum]